jgi:hypothetical protein
MEIGGQNARGGRGKIKSQGRLTLAFNGWALFLNLDDFVGRAHHSAHELESLFSLGEILASRYIQTLIATTQPSGFVQFFPNDSVNLHSV